MESLRQFVVVYNAVLATPAAALVPNRSSSAVPLDPSATWRGGTRYMGNSLSSINHCPGLHPHNHQIHTYTCTWRGHSSFAFSVDTTRGAADTGYKSSLNWRRARRQGNTASDGGRDFRISLDSYRPPQAGQPPASKVLSRHSLPSSLGAWGSGTIRKVDCNFCTKQQKNANEETSSKTGMLECPDHVARSFR